MQWFKDFINSFWNFLHDIAIFILDGLIYVIGFVLYTIFDGFLIVVHSFFSVLDLSAVVFTYSAEWSNLPTQLVWLINELAVPQCIAIVAGALLIRVILNIIPAAFTRV